MTKAFLKAILAHIDNSPNYYNIPTMKSYVKWNEKKIKELKKEIEKRETKITAFQIKILEKKGKRKR